MTGQFIINIQLAEREFESGDFADDPRFVPEERPSLREVGARLLRSSAHSGLRLADRLDPACHPA
jgi:hypothetical protein